MDASANMSNSRSSQRRFSKSRSMVDLTTKANSRENVEGLSAEMNASDSDIAEDILLNQADMSQSSSGFHRRHLSLRLKIWLSKKYEELVDDFSEVKTEVEIPDTEGDQLSPFKVRKNLIRMGDFVDVLEDFIKSYNSITRWQNPAVSFMVFAIYMIVIYKDWLLATLFLSIISAFFFTYLRHKGWSFGNEVEHINNSTNTEIEKDLTMKDQISIIINVARKAQNYSGLGADVLEKIRNLLLWREPELTHPVVILFGMALIGALLFPIYFLVKMAALGLGIYIFVIQYAFSRFPRFDQKYNVVWQYISQLKTDAQYETEIKKIKKDIKKTKKLSRSISVIQNSSSLATTPAGSSQSLNTFETSFHDTFQLPVSEIVLTAWKNGRRCFLVNKEKYFSLGFKIGRMYLTNNHLCFQQSKTENCKTVVVPLDTIDTIAKAKLYQLVPGGGKAIEITLKNTRKALLFVFQVNVFGPIINRDEAFDAIMVVGTTNDYTWAKPR